MISINDHDITSFATTLFKQSDYNIYVKTNGKEGINFMWELEGQKNTSETLVVSEDNSTTNYLVKLSGITENTMNFIILSTSIEVTGQWAI